MSRRRMLADMDTGGVEVIAATVAHTHDRGARMFKRVESACDKVLCKVAL